MSLRFSIAALTALLSGCAGEHGATSSLAPSRPVAITYGSVDATNAYRNVGAFVVKRTSDGHIFPICSGTLIAPTVFLTAGHCTAYFLNVLPSSGFTAAISLSTPIGWGDLTNLALINLIPAVSVVTDPDFNQRQSDPDDLGVILLPTGATTGVTPAVLPTLGLLDLLSAQGGLRGATFTAVGYGVQNRLVGGGVPSFQDQNPIPRMYAFSSFLSLGPGYVRLSQNPATGDGGTCNG